MDTLKTIVGRIERRLMVVEMKAATASKAAGLSPSAIYNLQRGAKGKIPVKGGNIATFAKLAPVLRSTVEWLTEGKGPEEPDADERTIPVWGRAGAGGTVYSFHEATPIGRIPAPPESDDTTGAVEINGASLGRIFDGWYAVYDERRDPPTTDLIGQLCIVGLADGRVMIKQLAKGRGKRFTLESNYEAPVYDVVVEWAAPVKNMVPR